MDKEWGKLALRLLAASKDDIGPILSGVDRDRGDRGILKIPEEMVNQRWREIVLEMAQGKLEDYQVSFRDNEIHLEAQVKMLVRTRLHLVFRIKEFAFSPKGRNIVLSYETVGTSLANPFVPKVLEMAANKIPELVMVQGKDLHFLLNSVEEIPPWLAVKYRGTKDGVLEVAFLIV